MSKPIPTPPGMQRAATEYVANEVVTGDLDLGGKSFEWRVAEVIRIMKKADLYKAENERLKEVNAVMLEALENLGCTCEYGIGRPGMMRHSSKCQAAHDAIAKAKGEAPTE